MSVRNIEDLRDSIEFLAYRDTYSRILHEVLGIPIAHGRRQVDQWLHEESFRVWFGHTSPAQDAAPQIVSKLMPAELRKRAGAAIGDACLCREFAEAIEGAGDSYNDQPDTNPNYDWGECRVRIRDLVARFEKEFPNK